MGVEVDAALFFGECAEWVGVEFLEGFLGSGYEVVCEFEGGSVSSSVSGASPSVKHYFRITCRSERNLRIRIW